jgi:hypothetical protein
MNNVVEGSRTGLRRAIPFSLLVVLMAASGVTAWASSGRADSSHRGPEGGLVFNVPTLGSASTSLTGKTVDGISCRTQKTEVVKYHIHTYVSVYVNGHQERLPAGIGITKPALVEHYPTGIFYDVGLYNCLYWVHTHAFDGIVHVEASAKGNFTLGQFFDIWDQTLSSTQVGPAKGNVIVFENGRQLTGDPRAVPLSPHGVIQIDVGGPLVPFHPFTYKVAGACGQGTTSCAIKSKG